MYSQLASRLALKTSTTLIDYSQPVALEGANAARLDFVVFNINATSITARLEGSNDLQNWENLANAPTGRSTPGYYLETLETNVAFAYVRLKYTLTAGGADKYCILDAGVYTFEE